MDLRAELAPLFLDEPPQPPVHGALRAGRRALRRRRVGSGLAAVAVLAALGASYAVTSVGAAVDQTPVEPSGRTPAAATDARDRGFTVDPATGTVVPLDGTEILDSEVVAAMPGWDRTVAVDAVVGETETWYLLGWGKVGKDWTAQFDNHTAPVPGTTFRAWVDDLVADQAVPTNPAPGDQLVVTDRYGAWTLAPGSALVRQIDNPYDLPSPYTSAALELRRGKTTYDVVLTPQTMRARKAAGPDSLEGLIGEVRGDGPSYTSAGPGKALTDLRTGMAIPRSGVDVVRSVDNPLGVASPRRSVAYVLRKGDQTWWYLWERGPSGMNGAETTRDADDGYPSLEAWLADQKSTTRW